MDLFDLAARITLNTSQAEATLKKFGGAAKAALGAVAKISAAAVGAAATGVSAMVKQSVDAYAEFEQLAGGIKKLYKTEVNDATADVMEYASNAYKTVGMSANEYMSSTTAFSAKLLSDFGNDAKKAAQYADKAMRQIADNANTFGKYSVQELTGVYQALARGSYMTLDNLNLGFSGTKEGMQELLDKAHELTGLKYDINNFSDVIDAIGAVQDSLNITGTTTKEAATTIEGSMNSLKASWKNLLVGMASDEANFDKLIDNLVESLLGIEENGKRVGGVINNIMPRVQKALKGVSTIIRKAVPILSKELPGLIRSILPDLLGAAGDLVGGVAAALPDLLHVIIDSIVRNQDQILAAVSGLLQVVGDALKNPQAIIDFIGVASNILSEFINAISDEKNAEAITRGAVQILGALANALIQNAGQLALAIPSILTGIIKGIFSSEDPSVNDIGDEIIGGINTSLSNGSDKLNIAGEGMADDLVDGLDYKFAFRIGEFSGKVFGAITAIIVNANEALKDFLKGDFSEGFDKLKSSFEEFNLEMAMGFEVGAREGLDKIGGRAAEISKEIDKATKAAEGFKVAEQNAQSASTTITQVSGFVNDVTQKFPPMWQEAADGTTNAFEPVPSIVGGYFDQIVANSETSGVDTVSEYISGAESQFDRLRATMSKMAGIIKSFVGFSEPEEGPLSNFHTYAPDMMALFAKGITDNEGMLRGVVANAFDFSNLTSMSPPSITYSATGGGELLQLLRQYLPAIVNRPIVLDSGELVSVTLPMIDEGLGEMSVYAGRANA